MCIGGVAAIAAVVLGRTDFATRIESSTYDARVRREATPVPSDSPIVVIEINESTVRALEPIVGRWPWPRLVHASAIDYLARAGARTIAYDILFTEREGWSDSIVNGRAISGEESDRALVDAVGRAGNVILLANVIYEGLSLGDDAEPLPELVPGPRYQPGSGFQARPNLDLPFDELAQVAAGIGHNYLPKDPNSDAVRRILPFVDVAGRAVPSLGLAAALAHAGVAAESVAVARDGLRIDDHRTVPLLSDPVGPAREPSRQVLLRLPRPVEHGDERWIFQSYSFFDVLLSAERMASGEPPPIPAGAFDGKLVFVGTTAAGMYDRHSTPFAGGAAGVELHAALAENVRAGMFMRRAGSGVDAAYALGVGLAVALASTLLPVALALPAAAGVVGVATVWLSHEVGRGAWIALMPAALAGGLSLVGGIAWRYFVEDREKRHLRQLFGRYVSKDVIRELLTNPALAKLGGERREMTVLFSDIRGFTTASEAGRPEDVVRQLNEYFGAMVDVLFRHQGTLDKFVGDMVMGLFGAPVPDDNHADHAVAAALEMVQVLDRLNVKWEREGRPRLDIGIGINSGEMIAGNVGSDAIMSYTVIGDAVNLGARLESLNKEFGTRILMSGMTRARLTVPVASRSRGEVTVKGKTQAVEVFEVLTKEHGNVS